MGKSMMSIHKQIEKEAYRKSPLGELEHELKSIYDELQEKKITPTLSVANEVRKIRDANEKAQMDYIEGYKAKVQKLNDEHKEFVDKTLFEAMSKEVKLLRGFLKK